MLYYYKEFTLGQCLFLPIKNYIIEMQNTKNSFQLENCRDKIDILKLQHNFRRLKCLFLLIQTD